MVKNKKISICILVYNGYYHFSRIFPLICQAVDKNASEIEVVISDNASDEDIISIVDKGRNDFPGVEIKYYRNEKNMGFAINYLRAINRATAEYVWVIGNDDFIRPDGISKVIEVLNENKKIDFMAVGIQTFNIINNIEQLESYASSGVDNIKYENLRNINAKSGMMPFKELVSPKYRNVLLGSIMVSIYRRNLLNNFQYDEEEYNNFENLKGIYPHLIVYSKCYMDSCGYYMDCDVISVGDGVRFWEGTSKNYFESKSPLIDLKISRDIVDNYEKHGIVRKQLVEMKKSISFNPGYHFIDVLFKNRTIEGKAFELTWLDLLKNNWKFLNFYYAFCVRIAMSILVFLKIK